MIDVDRLLDEIERAELHRLDGVLDRAERRHHDDRDSRDRSPDLPQNGDAVRARQVADR